MAFLDRTDASLVVIAHRGFSPGRHADENSLAAFAQAMSLGVSHLETDVRVSSDGVALAFHDRVLDRVTDAHGEVAQLSWAQIRRARIGGAEPIPRLADVLDAFPTACVNIDVKSDAGVLPTVTAVQQAGAQDRVCVAAFSGRRLRRLQTALGPRVASALGPAEVARLWWAASTGRPALLGRPVAPAGHRRAVQVPPRVGRATLVDRRLVRMCHRLAMPVHVWTINDPAQMRELVALGVDGLITDRADLALQVVGRARS